MTQKERAATLHACRLYRRTLIAGRDAASRLSRKNNGRGFGGAAAGQNDTRKEPGF